MIDLYIFCQFQKDRRGLCAHIFSIGKISEGADWQVHEAAQEQGSEHEHDVIPLRFVLQTPEHWTRIRHTLKQQHQCSVTEKPYI